MTENKYNNSKIYKIVCNITNEVYYGSTIKTLNNRLSNHKSSKNNTTSRIIIKRGDYKIELVENYPCTCKAKLHKREGYYQLNYPCINKSIAGRTYAEWVKTDKGKESDKKRREKYQKTDKCKSKEEKYENKRRLMMCCPLCDKSFQKREWYKHLESKVHKENESSCNLKYCKCGGCMCSYLKISVSTRIDHENSEQHQEWLKSGIKAIEC